jgi:hypothetical protein
MNTLLAVAQANVHGLREILDGPYPHNNSTTSISDDRAAFEMLVQNYQSCMNVSAIRASKSTGLQKILRDVAQLFPANLSIGTANVTLVEADLEPFADAIAYLSRIGVPIFGEFWTSPDPQVPV